MRWLAPALAVLVAVVVAPPARADSKDVCSDSYVEAQRLRKEGKLREAHDATLRCAATACPPFIRNDCTKWVAEIEHAMPSVIFAAKDERGQDLSDVQVLVDGQKTADKLDGRPVNLDPGPHTVRFQQGSRTTEQKVVLNEGDSNRRIEGDFAPSAPAAPPKPAPEPSPSGGGRRIPTATLILGGVAAVGLASFITFAVLGKSKESCAPNCSQSDVSTLRRDYAIADISWIVGLAAAGGAVYFWLSQPSAASTATGKAALRLEAHPLPGGGALGLAGSFQ